MTDAFGAMQVFGDMWTRGTQAFFEGQQKWFGDLAKAALGEQMGIVQPDMSGLKAAQQAYSTSLTNAMNLSSELLKSFAATQSPPVGTSLLPKILEPHAWWAATADLDGSVARLQEGPQLADVGQVERKFAAVYSAIVALSQRSLEHQVVMTNAWARAANTFMNRPSAGTEAKKTFADSWRGLTFDWIGTANDELIATQRSEAYLSSQRNLLKASTDLRLARQELAAFYGEMFGLPTRAEIDDVHKTVTELRREIRALKRSVNPVRER
jgi:hypothetical protein